MDEETDDDIETTGRLRALVPDSPGMPAGQLAQLRWLYSELQDVATAAVEALGSSGAGPTGLTLDRFRDLDLRICELVEQIINTNAGAAD